MKAYGYVRGQVDDNDFTRQQDQIFAYAKANRIEVTAIFREKIDLEATGENECPALKEMLATILAIGAGTVIVEGLDKLAPERQVQSSLLIYLNSKGITLITAGTGKDVTASVLSDPRGKALVTMQGMFAELENSLLGKKLRLARERKRAREGKCEGRKSLTETSPGTVEAIRQLRRKVPGCKRLTDAQVAEELNDNGLVTASGKTWNRFHVQNVRKALNIS